MPRVIRKQPGRLVKRKSKNSESTAESGLESNQFNFIGDLISNYGMTGENVAHQIFSQLDFSSLQQGQLVCKTWNRFLANDRNLILKLLMKTKPYLEYLSKELSDSNEPEDTAVWKDFFDSIKRLDEAENLRKVYSVQPERRAKIKLDKLLQLFRKIHSIFAVIQDWGEENGCQIEGYYLPEDFNNLTVGKKLATEIRKEIIAQNNPFFMWINEKLSEIENYKNTRAEIVKELTCKEMQMQEPNSESDEENDEMAPDQECPGCVYTRTINKSKKKLLKGIKKQLFSVL